MKIEADLTSLEKESLLTLLIYIKEKGPPADYAMRTSQRERDLISALTKLNDPS